MPRAHSWQKVEPKCQLGHSEDKALYSQPLEANRCIPSDISPGAWRQKLKPYLQDCGVWRVERKFNIKWEKHICVEWNVPPGESWLIITRLSLVPPPDESVTFWLRRRRRALGLPRGGVTWPRATGKVWLHRLYCPQMESHTQTQG